jgi:serine/threonine protein kinase
MIQQLLNDRYRTIRVLGAGSFGETFLAEDIQMPSRRHCVIKKLKPIKDNPEVFLLVQERFRREAAILEELGGSSGQIPDLYAYFQTSDQFYLVQELIEGETIKRRLQQVGRLSEETVREILVNLLPVLDFVHSNGIIHRDLKPDNIMLRNSDSKPVLIDFGSVRELMGTDLNPDGSSTSSIVVGTRGYMPNEQAAGRPVYSSDLYSLGMTAIYLLTGKQPLSLASDDHTGELVWHQAAPEISSSMKTVIDRAIKSHPSDRYPTAKEMLADLQFDASSTIIATDASSKTGNALGNSSPTNSETSTIFVTTVFNPSRPFLETATPSIPTNLKSGSSQNNVIVNNNFSNNSSTIFTPPVFPQPSDYTFEVPPSGFHQVTPTIPSSPQFASYTSGFPQSVPYSSGFPQAANYNNNPEIVLPGKAISNGLIGIFVIIATVGIVIAGGLIGASVIIGLVLTKSSHAPATSSTTATATHSPVAVSPKPLPTMAGKDYGWLSRRPVTDEDLEGKNGYELDIMKSWAYAIHGRRFEIKGLQEYFDKQSWYHPEYPPNKFPENLLSDAERKNIEYIDHYQDRYNRRYFSK